MSFRMTSRYRCGHHGPHTCIARSEESQDAIVRVATEILMHRNRATAAECGRSTRRSPD